MKKISSLSAIALISTSLSGCVTCSGDNLSELKSIQPMMSPRIEITVGPDYEYNSDSAMDPGNSENFGRSINYEVISALWEKNGYIKDSTLVKYGQFTGDADYNMSLSGRTIVENNVGMQTLSSLLVYTIPASHNQSIDITYTLENQDTGDVYTASARESCSTTMWLPFMFAPLFQDNKIEKMTERLSEHIYQDFVKQGAFSPEQVD